ncbi:rRNA maturation RNase YbeY [Taibaiella koreensis]|uniref:rRNA maturation RNase YbeY n=1 Tax=Taibaiella koreensis TaxID=1268548 RepID=UPI000E59A5CF|nr:rRNA maturation RNase YbeY [Taibaiella koreensis]
MAIHYYEQEVRSELKDKRRLSAFISSLVKAHLAVKQINLNYIFCSDASLLEKNRHFLNHDTLTDIITFDLSERKSVLDGEIYISIDRVRENAAKFGHTYLAELHRVIFHGALHLCGFKDKKKEDKALMTEMEDQCLQKYLTDQ